MNKAFTILLTLLFTSISLFGQAPHFQKYFLLKKNQQVQVNAIFQDKAGFIWYGTNKGLFKFDGINFKRYTQANSLPDENVTAIAQDSLGRIWTGHKNGKLAFLEKTNFISFDPPEGAAIQQVSDILFDRRGNLWFSTINDGLYYYTKERLYRLDKSDGMPDLFIYDLMEDSLGNIWVGTDGGIAVCQLIDRKVNLKVIDYRNGLPDNIIKKFVLEEDNSILMATEDEGVIRYNPSTGTYLPLMKDTWKYGSITDFLVSSNKIWISVSQTGLVVYDLETKQVKVYTSKVDEYLASVNTLAKDFEGNIWVGSKAGVVRSYGDYVELIENFDGAKNSNILALTIDAQDQIWFSNNEGLFKRKIEKSGIITTEQPLRSTPFQKYTIISLHCDAKGYIWAGLYGEGVLRINPLSGKVTYLNKELRNGNVLSITGKDNVIWLATLGGGVQIKIEGDKLDIKNYSKNEGLISDYIYQVFMDSKDRVWFATDGKGVDMLDEKGFHHFNSELNSKVVYGLAEDADHTLWANVQGDGLYKFDSKKFRPIEEVRLRDNNINAFGADNSGNLVIMNDLGIDVINISQRKIHYLGDEVGIHNKIANLNAVVKDRYGRLFFGTDGGIVSYSGSLGKRSLAPKPFIDGFKVLNQRVDMGSELVLKHNQNSVTVTYLGFWYQNPDNLNFRYTLANYDKEWITSRDHAATYSSLPPGSYVFKLSVSDTEDFEGAAEATFHFTIQPPIWRTKTFYSITIILVVLLGYGFLKYRERKLVSDKQALEEKVEARTQEIQKKNEEIQAQAEEIRGMNENLEMLVQERTSEVERKNKAMEESAFIIAHELRAPVASILGLVNLISKSALDDDGKAIVKHMNDSARKLNSIVRKITTTIEQGDGTDNPPT